MSLLVEEKGLSIIKQILLCYSVMLLLHYLCLNIDDGSIWILTQNVFLSILD